MTEFHDINDLLQVLQDQPTWREQLRSVLLTDRLLELPDRVDALAKQMITLTGIVTNLVEEQQTTNRRLDSIDRQLDQMDRRLDNMDHRFENMDRRFDRMENDMGELKGTVLETKARELARLIAADLALTHPRVLTRDDLMDIAENRISGPERRSFVAADLVILCEDQEGANKYLAIEISWTASEQDAARAQRNATFIQEWTGHETLPMIYSVRNTGEVEQAVERGEILHHQAGE